MGNFISSMPREINQDALLLNLLLVRTKGKVSLEQVSYMCVTGGTREGKQFRCFALPALPLQANHSSK